MLETFDKGLPLVEEDDSSFDDEGSVAGSSVSIRPNELGAQETKLVNYSKLMLLLIVAIFAVTMGRLTFVFVGDQEQAERDRKFEGFANEIIPLAQARTKGIFDSLKTVSTTISSYALDVGATWPFVRVPHFQVRGMMSNAITGASVLDFNPLVYGRDVAKWNNFSVENSDWIQEGRTIGRQVDPDVFVDDHQAENPSSMFVPFLHEYAYVDGEISIVPTIPESPDEIHSPLWQKAPVPDSLSVNFDGMSIPWVRDYLYEGLLQNDQALLLPPNTGDDVPHSYLIQPVYDTFYPNRTIVAFLNANLRWDKFFVDLLLENSRGVIVVVEGTCNSTFSFQINGPEPQFLGEGDFHDEKFENLGKSFDFAPYATLEPTTEHVFCQYSATVYPSEAWGYLDNSKSWKYSLSIVGCFMVTSIFFLLYDLLVQKRQRAVMDSAVKTNAIVSSLFPSNVRDRLIDELEQGEKGASKNHKSGVNTTFLNTQSTMDTVFSNSSANEKKLFEGKPIAELYLNTTIMFADIAGFTAWSSVREPSQVFTLLELLYHSFDTIAKKMRVFKVETIGDCYVAVAGLPKPRKDHAIVMARFALECRDRMNVLAKELETSLGPDTSDLGLRIGLHSGPVTAGVLRGDKGRFQLFGDTMNTASRMESTSSKNLVQVSIDTANILKAQGKGRWVTLREDVVVAKGKGEMQTYWLNRQAETMTTVSSGYAKDQPPHMIASPAENFMQEHKKSFGMSTEDGHGIEKNGRLVQWNIEILSRLLQKIIANRGTSSSSTYEVVELDSTLDRNILGEVHDVIALPKYQKNARANGRVGFQNGTVPPSAVIQLSNFVKKVASMYTANPFHNFEHASHVTMSVNKLLRRIVDPDEEAHEEVHKKTFGIASDPLTQFACVFSALLHDLDHPGVPNSILVAERDSLAKRYENKSIAEQNSIALAWQELMTPSYADLRSCIYTTQAEHDRFRQLVVNMIMATDIMDKDLGNMRKNRWETAFHPRSSMAAEKPSMQSDRKATIVLEHLIQASDVAHTMQHWHVYVKWNERLFHEMYQGYQSGRAEKDPSKFWYQGELAFFDYYIIPLAKKLATCGVFGVSSDEYLNYAKANRQEWCEKGADMTLKYLQKYATNIAPPAESSREDVLDHRDSSVSL